MPTIEHIGIWVKNLDAMAAFYADVLDATPGAKYTNPDKSFSSIFMTLNTGARLELMTMPGLAEPLTGVCYGYAHVAFSLGSTRAVDDVTARLAAAGCSVVSQPRRTGDGYYESQVQDPEGNRLELTL